MQRTCAITSQLRRSSAAAELRSHCCTGLGRLVVDADAGVGEGVGDPWRGGESDAIVSLTAHHPLLLLQPHPARTAMPSSYHCCSYMPSYNPTLLIYAAAPGEEVDCHPHFHIFSGFPHWDIFCCGRHCHLIWLWIMDVLCLWVVLECIPPKSSLSPIGSSPFFQLCCVPTIHFL